MKKLTIILFIFVVVLQACSKKDEVPYPIEVYRGDSLTIGVVGPIPSIKSEDVFFVSLTLADVLANNLKGADAVLIMKEHVKEAAEEPFANVYETSDVLFVFAESEKLLLAFIDPDVSYDGALPLRSKDYFIGYLKGDSFGMSLYNNAKNDKNLQEVYHRLFFFIEKVKQTGGIS